MEETWWSSPLGSAGGRCDLAGEHHWQYTLGMCALVRGAIAVCFVHCSASTVCSRAATSILVLRRQLLSCRALPVAVQVTHISFKPVLHYEQFTLYNEFVTNVISLGSYHLDGDVMRIFFGESDSMLEPHAPDAWLIPTFIPSSG